ncbi:hypothetical protein ABZS83_02110 [Streptomyces sp. NPDC005426]|uniref:hypothetical protein n=1 Tax=Streptomyces sp. NPDC005426 TaxID=3155344 RepID=UPI0033BE2B39
MPTDEVPVKRAAPLKENAFGLLQLAGVGGVDIEAFDADEYTLRLLLNQEGMWSRSGESGSAVVNERNKIVALHLGGDGTRGYASGFAPIAFAFGL